MYVLHIQKESIDLLLLQDLFPPTGLKPFLEHTVVAHQTPHIPTLAA